MVGADDFKQAYRQVSLYQLGTSRKELIPDVRWLCWRDWRARAVEELLNGSAAWLRDAVVDTNTEQVTLRSNGVTVHDSTIRIRLSSVMRSARYWSGNCGCHWGTAARKQASM